MEDVLLVKRAIKGDRQAFEKLMDIYLLMTWIEKENTGK